MVIKGRNVNEIIFRITWLGLLLFVFLACSSNDQAENNENETSDSPELEDTTENVDGICLEYRGYEPDEGGQFLVANITMGMVIDLLHLKSSYIMKIILCFLHWMRYLRKEMMC